MFGKSVNVLLSDGGEFMYEVHVLFIQQETLLFTLLLFYLHEYALLIII